MDRNKTSNSATFYINIIKNIPLFANLEDDELQEIVKNAQISTCKKGKILFFRDQKVVNFYIILSGLAKLSVSNFEGEETVLQIVNSGNSLDNLFNKVFAADAQIIEDAVILSIPSAKFKELVKRNLCMAVNMLSDMASHNQELTNQILQLKLGNAHQKVGQFLLKAAFEKGSKKEREIDLKCDKSTIASYLGIRPETLSRILKKLKSEEEISIKKNKITLLQKHSLCRYCDDEKIIAKCSDHGSSFCKAK